MIAVVITAVATTLAIVAVGRVRTWLHRRRRMQRIWQRIQAEIAARPIEQQARLRRYVPREFRVNDDQP